MLNKIPRSDYWVCRVVQKPLWASLDHPAVWQLPLTKRFAPHIWRTLDGEGRRGSNKENWFVSMKFHRSLPKLWTKKMETGLGVQRARGWGKIAGWTLIEPNSWTWTWISNSLNYAAGKLYPIRLRIQSWFFCKCISICYRKMKEKKLKPQKSSNPDTEFLLKKEGRMEEIVGAAR